MPAGIFNIVSGVSTINFIFVWLIILACHLAYRRQHRSGVTQFRMPAYPASSWLTLLFFALILVILAFLPETRVPLIFSVGWFIVLFFAYDLSKKRK
jgi:AAT family amino acid transporter